MSIKSLECLAALYSTKNFHRAAEQCFISQPGLSSQIKKLETELGITLVERSKHQVIFNAAGTEVVRRAKQILADLQELKMVAQHFTDPLYGAVNIGIIPSLSPYLVPLIIGPMQAAYPNLDLSIHEIKTDDILLQLADNQLDAGILALPVDQDGLSHIDLFIEDFWLAVPSKNHLSSRQSVQLQDLSQEEVLLLEEGHCLRDQALEICNQKKITNFNLFKASSIETLRQMVAYGKGVTFLPHLAVSQPDQQMAHLIRYIRFEPPIPQRRIGMLFRHTSAKIAGFEGIAKIIKTAVTESGVQFM